MTLLRVKFGSNAHITVDDHAELIGTQVKVRLPSPTNPPFRGYMGTIVGVENGYLTVEFTDEQQSTPVEP